MRQCWVAVFSIRKGETSQCACDTTILHLREHLSPLLQASHSTLSRARSGASGTVVHAAHTSHSRERDYEAACVTHSGMLGLEFPVRNRELNGCARVSQRWCSTGCCTATRTLQTANTSKLTFRLQTLVRLNACVSSWIVFWILQVDAHNVHACSHPRLQQIRCVLMRYGLQAFEVRFSLDTLGA